MSHEVCDASSQCDSGDCHVCLGKPTEASIAGRYTKEPAVLLASKSPIISARGVVDDQIFQGPTQDPTPIQGALSTEPYQPVTRNLSTKPELSVQRFDVMFAGTMNEATALGHVFYTFFSCERVDVIMNQRSIGDYTIESFTKEPLPSLAAAFVEGWTCCARYEKALRDNTLPKDFYDPKHRGWGLGKK